MRSLRSPLDVSLSAALLLSNGALALLLVLLIAFPGELLNGTLEANYEEIQGWFASTRRVFGGVERAARRLPHWAGFAGFLVIIAVLYSFLDPGFGLNEASLALFLGLAAGLLVMSLAFDLPSVFHIRWLRGERATLQTLPGTLVIAAVCVGVSRLAHFQPGYIYGLLAGWAFSKELPERDEGRAVALSSACMFGISLLAWFAWIPVKAMAVQPGAGLPVLVLDGEKVMAWSRPGWLFLFFLGMFGLVHVLLDPSSGYIGHSPTASLLVVAGLFAGFALFSFAFWGYFRFRPERDSEGPPGGLVHSQSGEA